MTTKGIVTTFQTIEYAHCYDKKNKPIIKKKKTYTPKELRSPRKGMPEYVYAHGGETLLEITPFGAGTQMDTAQAYMHDVMSLDIRKLAGNRCES